MDEHLCISDVRNVIAEAIREVKYNLAREAYEHDLHIDAECATPAAYAEEKINMMTNYELLEAIALQIDN